MLENEMVLIRGKTDRTYSVLILVLLLLSLLFLFIMAWMYKEVENSLELGEGILLGLSGACIFTALYLLNTRIGRVIITQKNIYGRTNAGKSNSCFEIPLVQLKDIALINEHTLCFITLSNKEYSISNITNSFEIYRLLKEYLELREQKITDEEKEQALVQRARTSFLIKMIDI